MLNNHLAAPEQLFRFWASDITSSSLWRTGDSEKTRSLVFKKLQSSLRPQVLEPLMGGGEGGSEFSWIIKHAQVSSALLLVYVQTFRQTGVVERKPTPVTATRMGQTDVGLFSYTCSHIWTSCDSLGGGDYARKYNSSANMLQRTTDFQEMHVFVLYVACLFLLFL